MLAERVHHVVAGALLDGDRVLLGHRAPARRWFPDVWDLPGGHVEAGETEAAALRRELAEELGVDVRTVDPQPVTRIDDPVADMRLSIWAVRSWTGTPGNRCAEEHDELRWVTRQEIAGQALAHPRYAGLLAGLLDLSR